MEGSLNNMCSVNLRFACLLNYVTYSNAADDTPKLMSVKTKNESQARKKRLSKRYLRKIRL